MEGSIKDGPQASSLASPFSAFRSIFRGVFCLVLQISGEVSPSLWAIAHTSLVHSPAEGRGT